MRLRSHGKTHSAVDFESDPELVRVKKFHISNLKQLPPPKPKIEGEVGTAKTSLLVSFNWSTPETSDIDNWIAQLTERRIVNLNRKEDEDEVIPLWEESYYLPHGVKNLDEQFRASLGYRDENTPSNSNDESSCRRVRITPAALGVLFENPALVRSQRQNIQGDVTLTQETGGETVPSESSSTDLFTLLQQNLECKPQDNFLTRDAWVGLIRVDSVDVTIFPLGTAVMKIFFKWIFDGKPFSANDLYSWLFFSKIRHVIDGSFYGWILNYRKSINDSPTEIERKVLKKYYGKHIVKSMCNNYSISLTALGNWLLNDPNGDMDSPLVRLGTFEKRCYHHTFVSLKRPPPQHKIAEMLFYLCHAHGEKNGELHVPSLDNEQVGTASNQTTLQSRLNRYISVSREGSIFLSWPRKDNYRESDFVDLEWQREIKIYRILAIRALGEKSILLQLSKLSSYSGTLLKHVRDSHVDDLNRIRKRLFYFANLMTRYTLQMLNDDCGGSSEFTYYFTTIRQIFRIKEQRLELRDEIHDVLNLIEKSFLEQKRKVTEKSVQLKWKVKKLEYLHLKRKEEMIQRIGNVFGVISVVAFPITIVYAVTGMNTSNNEMITSMEELLIFTIGFFVAFLLSITFFLRVREEMSIRERGLKDDIIAAKSKRAFYNINKKPIEFKRSMY